MIYRNTWNSYPTFVKTIETVHQITVNDRRCILTSIATTELGNKLIDVRVWDNDTPRFGILFTEENAKQMLDDVDDVLRRLAAESAANNDRDGYGIFSSLGYNPFGDNSDDED